MTYEMDAGLWEPQKYGLKGVIWAASVGQDTCLQAVTGGGKSRVAAELFRWASSHGKRCCYYINRKLLIGQTIAEFQNKHLDFGVRAAEYEDYYDYKAPIQICSAPTELARVYRNQKRNDRPLWPKFECDIVVIDEAHIQRAATMQEIVDDHRSRGAVAIGMTATPIGVSHMYDNLIVSGTMEDYRKCCSIVPTEVYSFGLPDLRKVKRNSSGEFVLGERDRRNYTQSIVGNVLESWRKQNPDARPTMLFAPGKQESEWFTTQFTRQGVNWCHIDATSAIVDGQKTKLTLPLWREIQERYNDGDIKGISSRFKLREGVSLPKTYCGILATPIGSFASYVQIIGRILRYSSETPEHTVINDHGGCYLRHGDPNDTPNWRELWSMSHNQASTKHEKAIKDGDIPEPIRCPNCGRERNAGYTCLSCGHKAQRGTRHVIQEGGVLRKVTGNIIQVKKKRPYREWESMFWQWRNAGSKRTMKQLRAVYQKKHGHLPSEAPIQPKYAQDWDTKICHISMRDLDFKN